MELSSVQFLDPMERPIQKSTAQSTEGIRNQVHCLSFLQSFMYLTTKYWAPTVSQPLFQALEFNSTCNQVPTPMQSNCSQKTPPGSYFIHLTPSPAARPQIWEDSLHCENTCSYVRNSTHKPINSGESPQHPLTPPIFQVTWWPTFLNF